MVWAHYLRMKFRRFGRTQLQIPVFSCGGMRYQQSWADLPWNEVLKEGQANVEATLARSIELGINHIETARGYGSSEMQLGPILAQYPREKLILQTKVMPKPSAAEFLETFEISMAYLKQEYVDLLSIHGINNRVHLQETLRKGGVSRFAVNFREKGASATSGLAPMQHQTSSPRPSAVTSLIMSTCTGIS